MDRFEDLPESAISLLREYVAAGRYYLLLGSGVSLDSQGDGRTMRSANTLRGDLTALTEISSNSSLQQAYSLLTDEQVQSEITDHYNCSEAGDTITRIAARAWRRIYTFNVDNCYELIARRNYERAGIDPKSALSIPHFADDYSDLTPEVSTSIVHLHGYVETPGKGYVFSHSEYARNMARANSWMLTLVQLLKSEPFIIAGTSLDEMDVEFYLQQRSPAEARNDAPPSILVEPFPSRLTQRLCEKHGFWLYEGTAGQFMDELAKLAGPPANSWTPPPADRVVHGLQRVHQLQFAATFERVNAATAPEASSARFLLGSPLTWGMLAAGIDIPRTSTATLRARITKAISERGTRVFLVLDEAGAGRTTVLKRIAYDLAKTNSNVFWYSGRPLIDEDVCADTLNGVDGRLFIFVDDFADSQSFIERLLRNIEKKDIIFVGSERAYRRPYIEGGIGEDEYQIASIDLGLDQGEAERLVRLHESNGISTLAAKTPAEIAARGRELLGHPIAVAVCRIQNNYKPFDKIVDELLEATPRESQRAYATAAIARFCYAAGVRRHVLNSAVAPARLGELFSSSAALPLVESKGFVVPRRSVVADRVLARLIDQDRAGALGLFVRLAVALAPYVNRKQISARSPEARLAGRLMDFDQVVKRLINDDAEEFYALTKDDWSWNSRYWEQMSLLKLDRYLVDLTDDKLLQESIQHARHAYAIERHPLSLTTLAKILFAAMQTSTRALDDLFSEGWALITESIHIEMGWDNLRATAFVVCFQGVLTYVKNGGLLTGDQASDLRDLIATTYSRKLKDRRLSELRDEVSALVNA
jgi:hypothetical protein